MKQYAAILACSAFAASAAFGQNSMSFVVSNTISPGSPSATVEVWAHFDPDQFAFAGALWDVKATPDSGGFSDPYVILRSLGTSDGQVGPGGDSVDHIIAGQPHFPILGYNADTSNPILVWRATWGTDDFSPRQVGLETLTSKFHLYLDDSGFSEEFWSEDFVEGVATISVVPAPGVGAFALAVVGVVCRGCRREGSAPREALQPRIPFVHHADLANDGIHRPPARQRRGGVV